MLFQRGFPMTKPKRTIINSLLFVTTCLAPMVFFPMNANAQFVKAADRASAMKQHPQVVEEFGGAIEGPLGVYVSTIGEKTAKVANLGGQCKFTVLNSDVVNAFAVPGCYIYVTRGLLTIMNSEDELAAVLGHEIGHIEGKHSLKRQQKSTWATIGAIAVGIATKNQDIMNTAGQLAQVYTLSYSREQEHQSDDFGVKHLQANKYNLFAASDVMAALGAQETLDARVSSREARQIPTWARSHPVTSERVARTSAAATKAGATRTSPPKIITPFFNVINGLRVGDDPEQGIINGRVFAHPTMKITFEAPSGFSLTNSPQAVQIQSSSGISAQFTGGGALNNESLENYAKRVIKATIGQANAQIGTPRASTVNNLPAVSLLARAQSQSGKLVDIGVFAYNINGKAFNFTIIGPAGGLEASYPMTQSMRILSDAEAAKVRGRKIEIVSVSKNDTVESLAARMAYSDYQVERFKMINAITSDRALVVGEKLKIVTFDNIKK